MAEQTVTSDVIDATQEIVETAVDAAVAVTPRAEPKSDRAAPKARAKAARKAVPARRRQPARAAAAKKAPAKAEPAKNKAVRARKARIDQTQKQTKSARAGARTKGVTIMNKQTRNTVETGMFAADQFKTVFGDVNERAKAAAERSAKVAEELAELTRGNVEAFVASSKIAAKAVESLSQDAAEYSRKSFEDASAALKSFAEVKSPTDFFRLQGDYARAAFDGAIAESARLSETMLKFAGDVAEPIASRYTVAAERVKTLAA